MFLDHDHLLLESGMRVDFHHILQDHDLAELVMSIEMVADLLHESRLANMIDSLDMDERVGVDAVVECLDRLVQLDLPTNV